MNPYSHHGFNNQHMANLVSLKTQPFPMIYSEANLTHHVSSPINISEYISKKNITPIPLSCLNLKKKIKYPVKH